MICAGYVGAYLVIAQKRHPHLWRLVPSIFRAFEVEVKKLVQFAVC